MKKIILFSLLATPLLASAKGNIDSESKNVDINQSSSYKNISVGFSHTQFSTLLNTAFTQTFSNGFTYRVGGSGIYVHDFGGVVSDAGATQLNQQIGGGATASVGYFAHFSKHFNMISYLGFSYYHNLLYSYRDDAGNTRNSDMYYTYLGTTMLFKVNNFVTPFITLLGGYQRTQLTGNFTIGGKQYNNMSGHLNAFTSITSFGSRFYINSNFSISPYINLIYLVNYPGSSVTQSRDSGGFGFSRTNSSLVGYGLRMNYSWK